MKKELKDEILNCIDKYKEFAECYATTCRQIEDALSDAERSTFYRVFTKVIDSTFNDTELALSKGYEFINDLILEKS
jgi:hypothetical protein